MLLMGILNGPQAGSFLPVFAPSLGSDRSLTMATRGERGMQTNLSAHPWPVMQARSGLLSAHSPPNTDHLEGRCREVVMQAWGGWAETMISGHERLCVPASQVSN